MNKDSLSARILRIAGPSILLLWLGGGLLAGLRLVAPIQIGGLTDLMTRDSAAAGDRSAEVSRMILWMLAAQLSVAALSFWSETQLARLRERLGRGLTLDLLRRLLRFSPQYFREHDAETINARVLENTRAAAEFAAQMIVAAPLAVLSLVIFGGVMLSTHWFLGCCMLPLTLLSGYFLVFDRQIQQLNREHRKQWDEIRSASHELVAGVGEIRVQGAFDYGVRRIEARFERFRKLQTRSSRWNALFQVGEPFVAAVQNSAVYWLGAGLCLGGSSFAAISGRMTWGEVVQFLLVMQLFAGPVQQIAGYLLKWRMSRESHLRIHELWIEELAFGDEEECLSPDAAPVAAPGDFQFRDVNVTAPGGARILQGVQARIPSRQHAGIVGTAGCGKSTLLQLMIRGVDPSAGQVLLANRNIAAWGVQQLARDVGFVNQHPVIFAASIRDNILLGLRRPSTLVCQVDGESVDVSPWEHVASPRDLDRRVLDIARRLNFETDLFQKGLNSAPSDAAGCPLLRARIAALRQSFCDRLDPAHAALVVSFHDDAYCPEATLGENLLGPNTAWPTTPGKSEQRHLFACLNEAGLFEELLALGARRLREERRLAAQLSRRSSRLRELLRASCLQAELSAGRDPIRFLELDLHSQATLVRLALESPALAAAELAGAGDFASRAVRARHSLLAASAASPVNAYWPRGDTYDERLTVRENLLLGRINGHVLRAAPTIDNRLYELLRDAGVLEEVLVLGLDYQVGEGGNRLSGGQRQKIALARALVKRPQTLLLDEATANLDEISQRCVTDLLQHDFADQTVVAVSHRLATVRDCGQILVLDQGQIVQRGIYDQLATTPGLFQQLIQQEAGVPFTAGTPAIPTTGPSTTDREVLRGLTACSLFAELTSECLTILARSARIQSCPKGAVLFERGDVGEELYVILAGEVEFFVRATDAPERVETVEVYGAGRAFGELALLGAGRRTLGARARSDLRLCLLQRSDLLTVLEKEPHVGIALLQTLARRLAHLRDEQYGAAGNEASG